MPKTEEPDALERRMKECLRGVSKALSGTVDGLESAPWFDFPEASSMMSSFCQQVLAYRKTIEGHVDTQCSLLSQLLIDDNRNLAQLSIGEKKKIVEVSNNVRNDLNQRERRLLKLYWGFKAQAKEATVGSSGGGTRSSSLGLDPLSEVTSSLILTTRQLKQLSCTWSDILGSLESNHIFPRTVWQRVVKMSLNSTKVLRQELPRLENLIEAEKRRGLRKRGLTTRLRKVLDDLLLYPLLPSEVQSDIIHLKEAINGSNDTFVVGFCGMAKSGKSTFLNALLGNEVLPRQESCPSTLPCRIRHKSGQYKPEIQVNTILFDAACHTLRDLGISQRMGDIRTRMENGTSPTADEEELCNSWTNLHPRSREYLKRLEQPASIYLTQDVKTTLEHLNDIVGFCWRFGIPFHGRTREDWPLVITNIEFLQEWNLGNSVEFVDFPGVGDSIETFDFGQLKDCLQYVDTAVPIVSSLDIAKTDWRQLPTIIKGSGKTLGMTICTHSDLVSQEKIDIDSTIVARACGYPPHAVRSHSTPFCSPLLGLSAKMFRDTWKSAGTGFVFENIWGEGRMERMCAEAILGELNPKASFSRIQDWNTVISAVENESGMGETIKGLLGHVKASQRQPRSNHEQRQERLQAISKLLERLDPIGQDLRQTANSRSRNNTSTSVSAKIPSREEIRKFIVSVEDLRKSLQGFQLD